MPFSLWSPHLPGFWQHGGHGDMCQSRCQVLPASLLSLGAAWIWWNQLDGLEKIWVGKKESFRHTNYTPALPWLWHLFIQWAENRTQTNPFPVFLPIPMLPILRSCKLVKATCGISMPTGPLAKLNDKWFRNVLVVHGMKSYEIIDVMQKSSYQSPRCLRGCETNFQQTANKAWDHGTVSMQ